MMTFIAAVAVATHEFLYGAYSDPTSAAPYDVEPGLSPGQMRVVLPREPNKRTERYTGDPADPIRWATTEEIDAYDAAQPKPIDNRDLVLRRFTALECRGLLLIAINDASGIGAQALFSLLAGGPPDVHSPEFTQLLEYYKVAAIPSVFPDLATFEQRVSAICR